MRCTRCDTDNPIHARFCWNCGLALVGRCPHCQTEQAAGASFCISCGQPFTGSDLAADATPSKPESRPGTTSLAKRKQVTVLFADVSGFSVMAETMDVEDVRDTINAIWGRLDKIITQSGGRIDKHIGDAVMALFGVGVARENEPEQAVRAALAMQVELREVVASGPRGIPRLMMRIGLNTGPVILGAVGTTSEYTAMGDTVNLASQLEQAAPVGGILIAHDTYRHIRGVFDVEPLAPIAFKGKSEPVPVYVVLRAKPRALRFSVRGVEGVETRMIGREPELKSLQDACLGLLDKQTLHLCTVTGDAGIGKSRLLYEFNHWLQLRTQPVQVFKGRATEGMRGLPYSLFRDVFVLRFEIQDSDRAKVAREKFIRGFTELMLGSGQADALTGDELAMRARFVGHLLGLDFAADPHLRGILNDAKQIRGRAFHYLTQFFLAVTRSGPSATGGPRPAPVALLLEDIHWADEGSLDVIEHLAGACHSAALLILCLTRPQLFERRPVWGQGHGDHLRMTLQPLSKPDSRRLVEEILRKALKVPQALRELVVSGAEGNPYFVEELIKMMIDQKVIVPGEDEWQVEPGRLAEVRVPATLTGVLQARLDNLPPRERSVLQRASVVGRIFWDSAVERLASEVQVAIVAPAAESAPQPAAKTETQTALEALCRKELIFRRDTSSFAGANEFIFKHTLLRDVIYESVLKRVRRDYHAKTAAWLIALSGERVSQFAGVIAGHYEKAESVADAAEWYGRAGQQARSAYAPETAIGYYEKALTLVASVGPAEEHSTQRKRVEWNEGLGDALGSQARFAEAAMSYQAMRAAAETAGDTLGQARAWNGLAFVQERQGDNRASLESSGRAEALANRALALATSEAPTAQAPQAQGAGTLSAIARFEAETELARALYLRGWAYFRLGNPREVLVLGEQALSLSTRLQAQGVMADSLKLLAVGNLLLGQHQQADHFFNQALPTARELGDRRKVGVILNDLGESARSRGDYHAAVDYYQQALIIAREIGNRGDEMLNLSNLAGARVWLGQAACAEAEADLRQVINAAGTTLWFVAESHRFLAEACLGQGKIADAIEPARKALALGKKSESQEFVGGAWRTLGLAAAILGGAIPPSPAFPQPLEAAMCFEESLRVFTTMNAEGEQARTLRAWANFELQHGSREKGAAMWNQAREIFERLGMQLEVERMGAPPEAGQC